MTELKGPGFAEIKKFIKEQNLVEFHLIGDKIISGNILWHDEYLFHIQTEDGRSLTIMKPSILFYSKVK